VLPQNFVAVGQIREVWVRPMSRGDLPRAAAISRQVHGDRAENIHDLNAFLDDKENFGHIALVASVANKVAGFCTYARKGDAAMLFTIGVESQNQRARVGTALLRHVQGTFDPGGVIEHVAGERDTGMQMFLKAVGFLCVPPIRYGVTQDGDGVLHFIWRAER
jgi:ribosomal protein S18 acetylase RimI-like enzyme